MKKFSLSLGLGFIINNIVATVIAIFILNPLLNKMFNNSIRSQEEGLEMIPLLTGYFLLTLLMVVGYKYFSLKATWLKKRCYLGLVSGWLSLCFGLLNFSRFGKNTTNGYANYWIIRYISNSCCRNSNSLYL